MAIKGMASESGPRAEKPVYGLFNTTSSIFMDRLRAAILPVKLPINTGIMIMLASDMPAQGMGDNIIHLQLMMQKSSGETGALAGDASEDGQGASSASDPFEFMLVLRSQRVSHQAAAVMQQKEFIGAFQGVPMDHTFALCVLSGPVPAKWVHRSLGGAMQADKSFKPKACSLSENFPTPVAILSVVSCHTLHGCIAVLFVAYIHAASQCLFHSCHMQCAMRWSCLDPRPMSCRCSAARSRLSGHSCKCSALRSG